MRVQSRLHSVFLVGLIALPWASHANEYENSGIVVEHPWARPTPPVEPINAAAYLTIENRTDKAVSLTGVSTPVTNHASVHRSREVDGMMSMDAVKGGLEIPANGSVALEPMSYHVMLMGLEKPLEEGDAFPLTLIFNSVGDIDVEVNVQMGQH